jgi:hypothetical protein
VPFRALVGSLNIYERVPLVVPDERVASILNAVPLRSNVWNKSAVTHI